MADLVARTGLEALASRAHAVAVAGGPGVHLAVRHAALATVMARKGAGETLLHRAREHFGVDLPDTPRCVAGVDTAFAWCGPGQWLAMAEEGKDGAFADRLARAFDGVASVADQSGGRVILRASGPKVRAALAKGVPLDLHPRAFRPGDAAVTVVAHIGVHLWQVDDAPTYDLAVFRSFAAALWHWLGEAAAEFGTEVEAG